jgi:predicted Zn-ribbon and HTH transcriptional regulator
METNWEVPEFSPEHSSKMRHTIELISQGQISKAIKILELLMDQPLTPEIRRSLRRVIYILQCSGEQHKDLAIQILEALISGAEIPILLESPRCHQMGFGDLPQEELASIEVGRCKSQWTPEQIEQLQQASNFLSSDAIHNAIQILLFIRREISDESTREILDELINLLRNGYPQHLKVAENILAELLIEVRKILGQHFNTDRYMSSAKTEKFLGNRQRQNLELAMEMIRQDNVEHALTLVGNVRRELHRLDHTADLQKVLWDLHLIMDYLYSSDEQLIDLALVKIRLILRDY